LEFFIAGSTAISVGTANFINPRISLEIISGLKAYMEDNDIQNLSNITGKLKACKD